VRLRSIIYCAGTLALCFGSNATRADEIADFYRGKQLQVIVRSAPGGNFDQYSRLLFNTMVKHIPGNPTYIVKYLTGAGGIQAINYVEQGNPHDGTVFSLVNNGLILDQALGLAEGMKADLTKLNWIGNLTDSNGVMVAWHTSPAKTFEEAQKTPMHLGAAAASSIGTKFVQVANNLLGTKFKIIYGYPGNAELNLAMQRGETHGRAGGLWVTVKATNPDWIAEKKIYPLIQIGLQKEPDLPDVPLFMDLAQNSEDRAVLEFLTKGSAVGRPLATASGVPKARVEALRRAFNLTVKDPEFLAEAERVKAEIGPTPGEQVEQLVKDVMNTPPAIRALAQQAMEEKK
jgi:tripartite-type tricarboxylate transporter receptor subunit TctC